MPIKTATDLWQLLTFSAYGAAWTLFGLGMYVLGWSVGKNRGYAQVPERLKEEWREEHHYRLLAEGLLDAEKEGRRHDRVVIDQLVAGRPRQAEVVESRHGLRVARG